jgi:hypothetical protein
MSNAERKSIANYTSEVPVTKSYGEVMTLLHRFKATAILTEFDEVTRETKGVSFKIRTEHGELPFHMPVNIDGVWSILKNSKIENRLKTREQAARTAWHNVRAWLDAHIALIEAGQVKPEEVLLPYLQIGPGGATVYESLKESRFKALLPSGTGGGTQ